MSKKSIYRHWCCNIIQLSVWIRWCRSWSPEFKKKNNWILYLKKVSFSNICEQPTLISFRCYHLFAIWFGTSTHVYVHVQVRSIKTRRNHIRSSVLPGFFFNFFFCVSYNNWNWDKFGTKNNFTSTSLCFLIYFMK